MRWASLMTGPMQCASAKDNPMGSRDRTDRLLNAFKKDLDEAPEPAPVEDADRVYSELIAAGKLSKDRLDAAFDRMFPGQPPGLTAGDAVAAFLERRGWSAVKAAAEFQVAVELVEKARVLKQALSEETLAAAVDALNPPSAARPKLRQLLNTALVTARLSADPGPVMKAARKPPAK